MRIAATSADTYPAIGAMGLPIFVAVRLGTIEELGPNIAAYREAYRAAGHKGQGEVYLRVPVYVGETEKEARADPEHSIMQFYKTLGAQLEDSATRAGARAIEQRAERGQALQTIGYDDALRDKVIVGTPATVATRLRDLTRKLGLNGVLAELNCGGLIPNDKVMRSLQLMCEEVAPAVSIDREASALTASTPFGARRLQRNWAQHESYAQTRIRGSAVPISSSWTGAFADAPRADEAAQCASRRAAPLGKA